MVSLMNLPQYALLDPRLDMTQSHSKFFHMVGSDNVNTYQFPSQNYSQTNATFQIIPPNDRSVIDRGAVFMAVPVTINITGTSTSNGVYAYNPAYEGFRSRPIEKIITNEVHNLNGTSIQYNLNQLAMAMERFENNRENKQVTPTYCDPTQTYAGANGTNSSPFVPYLVNTDQPSRRSYPITVVSNVPASGGNPGTAQLTATLYRNMGDFPPFDMKDGHDLVGIYANPYTITDTFTSNLARIWSRDNVNHPAGAPTLFTVTIGQPVITMTIMSLPRDIVYPPMITYPYHNLPIYTTTYTVPSGNTQQMTSQIIQFDTTPSKIYILAMPSLSSIYASVANATGFTDTYMQYSGNLSITWANKTNLCASMTPIDVFEMARNNSYDHHYTWMDWIGIGGVVGNVAGQVNDPPLSGSIIAIDPVRDLGCEDYIVGMPNKINFQVSCGMTNISTQQTTYDFAIIPVYDGVLNMVGNAAQATTTTITSKAQLQPSPYSYNELKNLVGGSKVGDFFKSAWSKIKHVASPVLNFLKNSKLLSTVASPLLNMTPLSSLTGPITTGLQSLGLGEGDKFYGEDGEEAEGEGRRRLKRSTIGKRLKASRKY